MKYIKIALVNSKMVFFSFFFLLLSTVVNAQTPRNVPHPEDTYSFDLDYLPDIILYIVLPVIIIILYLLYRRRAKKRRNR